MLNSENMFNLTKNGLKLYGKIQTGETTLNITRVKIGSGYLATGETADDMAGLKQEENVDVTVSAFEIVGDGTAKATATIGSADNDYYLREIGIFASDPDAGEILYSYCNFGDYADYVKTFGGTLATVQEIDLYFAIGSAATVNVDVTGAAYVTYADLQKHTNNTDNPHEVTAEQVGFTNKSVLDGINADRANKWDDAVSEKHSHDNKGTLDSLTSENITSWDTAATHTTQKNNPHGVTAAQVGLGNVTNESKTTMFKSPSFTGTPTAPTPDDESSGTQIATTAFVQTAIQNRVAESLNYYGICSTARTESVKAVTIDSLDELTDGMRITVKFTYGLMIYSAKGLSIKINNFDALTLRHNGVDGVAGYGKDTAYTDFGGTISFIYCKNGNDEYLNIDAPEIVDSAWNVLNEITEGDIADGAVTNDKVESITGDKISDYSLSEMLARLNALTDTCYLTVTVITADDPDTSYGKIKYSVSGTWNDDTAAVISQDTEEYQEINEDLGARIYFIKDTDTYALSCRLEYAGTSGYTNEPSDIYIDINDDYMRTGTHVYTYTFKKEH